MQRMLSSRLPSRLSWKGSALAVPRCTALRSALMSVICCVLLSSNESTGGLGLGLSG